MIIKYFILYVQNNRAKHKFGGISVLIRKSLSDGVEPIPVIHSSIVWFKLKSTFLIHPKTFLCVFLHILPENASYTVKNGDDFCSVHFIQNLPFIQYFGF
jgi:hypothetical protein